jgi:Domain of unknown function (DUF4149)
MTIAAKFRQSSIQWYGVALFTAGFWLSSLLLLDLLIMPCLYGTGMMAAPDFASAGYSIFWNFNRIELLCAGLILVGIWSSHRQAGLSHRRMGWVAIALLAIALLDTYLLAPQMSALGMHLNWFALSDEVPQTMNQMHGLYWVSDILKLVGLGAIARHCFADITG